MKYDFITIGGAVIDETFDTEEGQLVDNSQDLTKQKLVGFEYGAKISISNYRKYFGGGAANTAVSLSRLGYKTATVSQLGNDQRGRDILENFKKERVSTKFIKVSQSMPTGFSFILVTKSNEHIAFTHRGANEGLQINFAEKKALNQAKWLYITSLSGEWEKVLDKVFSVVGVRFAWNPGSVQLKAGAKKLKKYIKYADVLVLNRDEAIELALSDDRWKKKSKKFLKKPENLLKVIKELGAEIAVVTCDKEGAYAYDGEKVYYEKSANVNNVADTTGVGDAFSSSFVAGLEYHQGNIQKAMKLGVKNSASVLKKPGAQNGLMKV